MRSQQKRMDIAAKQYICVCTKLEDDEYIDARLASMRVNS